MSGDGRPDVMATIDFGPSTVKEQWFFMVAPLADVVERRSLGWTKQFAASTHGEALKAWFDDEPAQECMRELGLVANGYYVARWSEECLNEYFFSWAEARKKKQEASWVEPRWFDAQGKEVAT